MALWELQAAEHYAARHEFLRSAPSSEPIAEEVTAKRPVFQLAKHSEQDKGSNSVDEGIDAERERLSTVVTNAVEASERTELAWRQHSERSSGLMEIASLPVVNAHTGAFPLWMLGSLLVVGLASCAIAVWFRQRLYSGLTHDPQTVATQLEKQGLGVVGQLTVTVPDSTLYGLDLAGRWLTTWIRNIARNLTTVSELVLAFWVLFILVRLLTDPMWRSIFLASPLAGFARIIVGMP